MSEPLSGFHGFCYLCRKAALSMGIKMKHLLVMMLYLLPILACTLSHATEDKMTYWNIQRKGANFFNQTPSEDWFIAAKEAGIQFARLAPDKWPCEQRDFLLGNADAFKRISISDFEILKRTLDQAYFHDIKIVITLLSLPGSRWNQNNQNQDDLRIWQSKEYQEQTTHFWKQLAFLLKDHPAVVGYNILNEPHPERLSGIRDFREADLQKWYMSVKSSLADLNLFYQNIIQAIREVDLFTPIVLDTGLYATPWAISYLIPAEDLKVIYSFHMYEPYAYTTRKINNNRYTYPGIVPTQLIDAEESKNPFCPTLHWDKTMLQKFLSPISEWQEKFKIPPSQILVGEFGCDRTAKGAAQYLDQLIKIFDTQKWHWAFYSFREDCWDGMDYELGAGKLSWQYWDAIEQKKNLTPFRQNNPLFDVIRNKLKE